jgi:hypothetical protein
MADREYVVTAINDVLTTLNRYVDSSSTDFQPVILRLDYLQKLVVNLAIDDFVIEIISLCTSQCKSPPPPPNRGGGGDLAGKVVSFDGKYVPDDGRLGQHFLFR